MHDGGAPAGGGHLDSPSHSGQQHGYAPGPRDGWPPDQLPDHGGTGRPGSRTAAPALVFAAVFGMFVLWTLFTILVHFH